MAAKNYINIVKRIFTSVFCLLLALTTFAKTENVRQTNKFTSFKDTFKFASKKEITKSEALQRLKEKAKQAKDYVYKEGYDISYCFMIDMRLPSGKNRFFIYQGRN